MKKTEFVFLKFPIAGEIQFYRKSKFNSFPK